MADRYWILGTGTWDSTSTTNWSASSGGAGGASVPTAADNVYFDANSNVLATAFTVTVTSAVCNDFNVGSPTALDGAMTLAMGSATLTVSGSWTNQATNFSTTNVGFTGAIIFNATTTGKTITTNGVTIAVGTTLNGVGGAWTLGSALNLGSSALNVTNGTFNTSTSNYAYTGGGFTSNNSNIRTINLNNSVLSLIGGGSAWNMATSTNATLNAGTSTINCSAASPTFAGGGLSYYNVSFTSTALASPSITGANTFNNLSLTGRTTVGIGILSIGADQTINGTLTVSAGTASAYRIQISSNTFNTTRTLTCAAVSLTDVDFRDITIAGAASPASGTRLGDCKGNSGITFPAAKTVYYRQTGSANWGATGSGSWSATSGSALDATQFPLAQDTAVFPAATYPASSSTTTINANYNIGTINMSLRTSNTMTLATGTTAPQIYGNWINGTGTTLSGTSALTFLGRTTQQITSSAKTFTQNIAINSIGGSVTLQDALTQSSTVATQLINGTLDLNGFTYTVGTGLATITGTKNLTFNGGTLVCPAASAFAFNNANPTNFTTTAGTGTGMISMTAATAKTFVGGGSTFNCTLNQGGAGALTITGSNTFGNITNTVQPASILFTAGTTSTFSNFSLSGTAGNLITIGSVTAASHTLSKASGTVSANYLSISRSTATGGAVWDAGATSTDGGNNSGWTFGAVSAVLTGVLASVLAGSVGPEFSIELSGVASSGLVETITLDTTTALIGVSVSGLVETVSPEVAALLTSSLSTGTVGTVVFSSVLLVDLTGVSASGAAGNIEHAKIVSLLGASALGSVGDVIAVYWKPIDDDQTPTWGSITNPQTPTWGSMANTQTPEWELIDSEQN